MESSRRNFLATGLVLPAAGLAMPTSGAPAPASAAPTAQTPFATAKLGRTGLKVTRLGFGCMVTSDASVITRAADAGINYFDTARVYQGGNNERMVGAALKGKRNQIYLSTKTHSTTKEAALRDLDTSLREIGTDHIDIWYLHGKDKASQLTDELLEAQQEAKKAGKIRFAGVSTHGGHEEIFPAAIKCGKIDVILTSYNFTMGEKIDPLIAAARKAGLGVVAMKVMAGGFRTNKEGSSKFNIFKREGALASALKWVLNNKDISTTIPSMTDNDQFEENVRASFTKFMPADEKRLVAHLEQIGPLYCRMCGSCSGVCPKGMPVADVLRYLAYAEGYKQYSLGREHFLALPKEVAAVRCGDCTECAVKCPNGVRVADRLIRAQEIFA